MSDKRQLLRLVVSNYELFKVFLDGLGERRESKPPPGFFQATGEVAGVDDLRISRGVTYIELLIDNYIVGADDLLLSLAIDLMLKRGYRTEYLDATWVSEVKTVVYATIKYRNPGGSWVNPTASTSIGDIGPYHLLRGVLIGIQAAVPA